jgi:hypothetical protein
LEQDEKACIVCPGKVLKHPKMIEVHKASSVCPSLTNLEFLGN